MTELVQEPGTVGGEKRKQGKRAFLQLVMRIERIK
jgi:hypothetical protein